MKDPCAAYLRRVSRSLCCPREDRQHLLAGLEAELYETFPAGTHPEMTELTARFGAPQTMAEELMAALPEGVQAGYQKKRRKRWMVATAVCLAVIAMLIGYLAWLASIDVDVTKTETYIVYVTEEEFP